MTTRTNWVPLHTILVVRDGVQVDAFAEHKRTGKAFKFTDDEVKEIIAAYDGNPSMALRSPTDEGEADDGTPIVETSTPLASNQKPKTAAPVKGKTDEL